MSTPYNGTVGHSGTDTSRERAERKAGHIDEELDVVVDFLTRAGTRGLTVTTVKRAALTGDDNQLRLAHHGTASAALSILHKSGRIARLTERRNGAHIYVTPENIDGRDFERFIGNRVKAQIAALDETLAELKRLIGSSAPVDRLGLMLARDAVLAQMQELTK